MVSSRTSRLPRGIHQHKLRRTPPHRAATRRWSSLDLPSRSLEKIKQIQGALIRCFNKGSLLKNKKIFPQRCFHKAKNCPKITQKAKPGFRSVGVGQRERTSKFLRVQMPRPPVPCFLGAVLCNKPPKNRAPLGVQMEVVVIFR